MEKFIHKDPANEMVLYYYRDCWEALGPLVKEKADKVVAWFNSAGYSAFICLEEDLAHLGLPNDLSAQPYFEEAPSWLEWSRMASSRHGTSEPLYEAAETSRHVAGRVSESWLNYSEMED